VVACFFVAKIFSLFDGFSYVGDRKSRFETLDGLRGYLALAVFLHHFVITYKWKTIGEFFSADEIYFQNMGKVGVAIFFMITGFLFFSKIISDKGRTNWLGLYESRFFRIMPLYISTVVMIVFFAFWATDFKLLVDFSTILLQVFKWVFFWGGEVNTYEDTKLIISGVHWTLKYEWIFYLSLPLVSALFVRLGFFSILLFLVLSIYLYYYPSYAIGLSTKYIYFFAFGSLVAWVVDELKGSYSEFFSNGYWSSLSIVLILCAVFYPDTFDFLHFILISLFFVLIVFGVDIFGLLKLRGSIILGEVSYSIYLLHGMVLYVLFSVFFNDVVTELSRSEYYMYMPLVGIVVVLLSIFTFWFIEKPAILYGKRYLLSNFISSFSVFRFNGK
jgi:peptidoglycan/LPS O-acetylase OafA/YrhL